MQDGALELRPIYVRWGRGFSQFTYLQAGASDYEVLAYMHLQAQKYQGFLIRQVLKAIIYIVCTWHLGPFASPCAQTLLLITHYVGTYNIAFELIS